MKYLLDSKGQIWPCLETKAIIHVEQNDYEVR